MNDKATIGAGLIVFLALAMFPIWYTLGAGDRTPPNLELPQDGSHCVEEDMVARHMGILDDWRNAVVRDGENEYEASSGKKYVMSLTGTCMKCHTSREAFCNQCHAYADVELSCWNCHVEPKGN